MGRPAANTELVSWNLPRQTAALIRAEAARMGSTPGAFVHRVMLTRYFQQGGEL